MSRATPLVVPNLIAVSALFMPLGGSWEATEQLLTEGAMQWAYSELFQNHSGLEVAPPPAEGEDEAEAKPGHEARGGRRTSELCGVTQCMKITLPAGAGRDTGRPNRPSVMSSVIMPAK